MGTPKNPFHVSGTVKYIGGRIRYRITAIDGRMVTMVRWDGKDGGNPTTTSFTNLGRV